MVNKFTSQNESGVSEYQNISKIAQEKYFDTLVEGIQIEEDWKIIDIGCGTGNNTFKVSKLVGKDGRVFGIDPIKERIQKARDVYQRPNLSFHEAFGNQVGQFEVEFDAAVSSTAMHFLSSEDKVATFKEIHKTLKTDGLFVFNLNRLSLLTFNKMDVIAGKLGCFDNFYVADTPAELEDICHKAGFRNVRVEAKDFPVKFENTDHLVRWYTASMHNVGYEEIVAKMKKLYEEDYPNDSLDDPVIYVDQYFMCYCQK
ncbi:arsenite methyltransferase-like [Clytia hemisphaerica]|uniref:Methyltransferase domain-containing protein n=1 Tax=Clytia hemisphaerica TaxID=252671 RepID=A0A7M5UTF7_9CNID